MTPSEHISLEVRPDAMAVACRAAAIIAERGRAAVTERGRFLLALSGGKTPSRMFPMLADEPMPWTDTHVFQVDERVAPAGDSARNLIPLQKNFLKSGVLPEANLHAMPVQQADLTAAAAQYAAELYGIAANPPVFDLIHLGLGSDGHTASLAPAAPALDIRDEDVVVTDVYAGWQRMTFTYRVLDNARLVLWIVTGADKATRLAQLMAGDVRIPAGRVRANNMIVLADVEAAAVWQKG